MKRKYVLRNAYCVIINRKDTEDTKVLEGLRNTYLRFTSRAKIGRYAYTIASYLTRGTPGVCVSYALTFQ